MKPDKNTTTKTMTSNTTTTTFTKDLECVANDYLYFKYHNLCRQWEKHLGLPQKCFEDEDDDDETRNTYWLMYSRRCNELETM